MVFGVFCLLEYDFWEGEIWRKAWDRLETELGEDLLSVVEVLGVSRLRACHSVDYRVPNS